MKTKILAVVFLISLSFLLSCSGRDNELQNDDSFIANPVDVSQLKISSPEKNETLEPGTTLKIEWSFPASISEVQISLYRKREFKALLSTKSRNTGYYEWKIPVDFQNSVHYRVKIAAYDNPGINKFSEYFFILKQ